MAIVTTTGVLVIGVLYGVLIAVALSVLVLLVDVARPHSAALGFVPELAGQSDKAIHAMHMGGGRPAAYPEQLIGHEAARARALAAWEEARGLD